jgi:hypothetical protein
MSKDLGVMVSELLRQYPDINNGLVTQQINALGRQYQKYNRIELQIDLIKQDTYVYLIIKKNLERGLYKNT